MAELGNDTVAVVDIRAGKVVDRLKGRAEPRALWRASASPASGRSCGSPRSPMARLSHEVQTTRMRAEIISLRTVAERLSAWLDVTASARGALD